MTNENNSNAVHDRFPRRPQSRYALPNGAREIILVRHGSTDIESRDVLQFGEMVLANPPLRTEGEAQASAVAERLRHEPISYIFITPLRRTGQTATPLAALTGIDPIVIPELREIYMGDWEHQFYMRAASGDPLIQQMYAEESWDVIPNAERMAEFALRVRTGIEKITNIVAANRSAVAVAHAATIATICRLATGSRPFAFMAPENTAISRLVVHGDGHWSLRCFNDVSHLSQHG